MSRSLADYTSTELRSIDELDAEIGGLVRQMTIECYRMLVLVRKLKNCAEWLPYRSDIGRAQAAHALDDFVDDGIDDDNPSAAGLRTTEVHRDLERSEVRESVAVYHLQRVARSLAPR